jgi:hypothetical protein
MDMMQQQDPKGTTLLNQRGARQPVNYRTEDRFRVITFFNVNMGGKKA